MRVFLVDDEDLARDRLKDLVSDCSEALGVSVVGESSDAEDALRQMESVRPDVVLLDVSMPGMSGMEMSRRMRESGMKSLVIFITAHEEHAAKAFDLDAVDYLVKPVRMERFREALERAKNRLDASSLPSSEKRKNLTCRQRGKIYLVPVDEVLYFKADCKYVTARTMEREYLLEDTLLSLEKEFGDRLVRIHRGALVSKKALVGVERSSGGDESDWSAIVSGCSEKLAISRRQWPLIKEMLSI